MWYCQRKKVHRYDTQCPKFSSLSIYTVKNIITLHSNIIYTYNTMLILSSYSSFSIGLDFFFIPFHLHFFLSWTSLSISSSAISTSKLSNHVLLGPPSPLISIHFFTQSWSILLIIYQYLLSLSLLMTVVIGSHQLSIFH